MADHDVFELLSVEVTVTRVGGPDVFRETGNPWPRDYGPRTLPIQAGPEDRLQWHAVQGVTAPWDCMGLKFLSFGLVEEDGRHGWYGGRLVLETVTGSTIGIVPRPFLYYGGPADVPSYTHFHDPHHGHYMVGMRSTVGRPLAPLADCPHCTDAVVNLPAHLMTCREAAEDQAADARGDA